MTTIDDNTLEVGEWGLFVARAVQDIRSELGEAVASRVATLLREQKADAIDAAREQMRSSQAMLECTLGEVAQARRSHERLQADVARMEAAVREAKEEAARIRATANDRDVRRRAEADASAEEESLRITEAWEEVRQQELDLAARRSELLDLDEHANQRRSEIEAAGAELAALRADIEEDRAEAQRLVEEAIERLDEIEQKTLAAEAEAEAEAETEAETEPETPEPDLESEPSELFVDLRVQDVDVRAATLDEREHELDEWESELVHRAQDLDHRAKVVAVLPPAGQNTSGWGRPTNPGD